MEKLFTRSKLKDAKHKIRFIFQLHFEIMKLCVMWNYTNIEVEWVLVDLLGKTPFELLKRIHEDGVVVDVIVEKHVNTSMSHSSIFSSKGFHLVMVPLHLSQKMQDFTFYMSMPTFFCHLPFNLHVKKLILCFEWMGFIHWLISSLMIPFK
jgi:hypothetical protein